MTDSRTTPTARIAVISDIHGNVPALEAVIADLKEQATDEVLVGGDLVGRGPQGSLVVRRVRDLGWRSVRGNHEDYVLTFRRGEIPAEWRDADEWSAARWMAAELSESDASYIASLPDSLTSHSRPALRLVHGSPRSNNEGLGPWCDNRELEGHVATVNEGLLVCGHTHRPLVRDLPSGRLVNVGSVGLPFNGDTRAQYAIFETDGRDWSVDLRQVHYDQEEILAIYESTGFRAAGGVTADLLRLELIHARPFLVPFLQWASATDVSPGAERIAPFLEFYRPDESIGNFLRRLAGLKRS